MGNLRIILGVVGCIAFLGSVIGCSTAPTREEYESHLEKQESLESEVSRLKDLVGDLETRLQAMNEKVSLTTTGALPQPAGPARAESPKIPVKIHQSAPAQKIKPVLKSDSPMGDNSESSAQRENPMDHEALDRFREAQILFEAQKFSDALIESAQFVKNFPSHVLAPRAQFMMGLSYFKQSEFKLAEEEWTRGVMKYGSTASAPDYLRGLYEVSQATGQNEQAEKYKSQLMISFGESPAARALLSGTGVYR